MTNQSQINDDLQKELRELRKVYDALKVSCKKDIEIIGAALLRKQAGDEILTLNESLERRIVERTEQLETINKELAFHLSELE